MLLLIEKGPDTNALYKEVNSNMKTLAPEAGIWGRDR